MFHFGKSFYKFIETISIFGNSFCKFLETILIFENQARKDELLRMGRLQAKRAREDEWLRLYEEKVKMHKDFAFAF